MRRIRLSAPQARRLERLAREAGRSPAKMLEHVLRDGFEYCEWQVRESLTSDAEAKRSGTTPHAVVMREAQEIVDIAQRGL